MRHAICGPFRRDTLMSSHTEPVLLGLTLVQYSIGICEERLLCKFQRATTMLHIFDPPYTSDIRVNDNLLVPRLHDSIHVAHPKHIHMWLAFLGVFHTQHIRCEHRGSLVVIRLTPINSMTVHIVGMMVARDSRATPRNANISQGCAYARQ